jgi:signal transduction histidine kinase
LTFFISRSIIKPLSLLKSAAEQIKTGNLDFTITYARRNELGELAATFESMRSQLKDSLEKQEQYEINRKELISGISHDLKTPITAIKGYVEGIMDGVANTPEKMERYIRTIHGKAGQLDKLIDELFLFSKLDLNKTPFNFETVDIKDYLQDFLEELRFDLEGKKTDLVFLADTDSPLQVTADREKLRRVMMNIIDNALKYTGEKAERGQISIRLNDQGERVMVSVADNGPGIKGEDLPFIFDRFYRSDPARSSAAGGSGLGLAIAKLIITEHGGEIWAESRLGQGATICFTLPKTCIPR